MISPLRRSGRNREPTGAPTNVVVLGTHSPDWMAALGPDAPVWRTLPQVAQVAHTDDPERAALLAGRDGVVVPLMEQHLAACPTGVRALVPGAAAVRLLGDKAAFAHHLRELGLDHWAPATYAGPAEARFPCVVKRTRLNSGHGVAVAASPARLTELLAAPMWAGHPVVLQEFIDSPAEHVTIALLVAGRVRWHVSYRFDTFPHQLGHGEHCLRVSTPSGVTDLLERVLAPLDYSGFCNADYRGTQQQVRLLEINPRLGGSLMRPDNTTDLKAAITALMRWARPRAASDGSTLSVWA